MTRRILRRRAKKARSGNIFIDDRAVDDDDEDAEDDDEDEEGLDEYEEDLDAEAVDQREGEALNRKLERAAAKGGGRELQEQVRQRYESADAQGRFMDADDALDQADGRFKELPDASRDPKLWLMRCKPNHEKMLVSALTPLCAHISLLLSRSCAHTPPPLHSLPHQVISLMQKYLDSMHTDQPLQIKSAMCTDVKGYIYLEAYKEKHVRDADAGAQPPLLPHPAGAE